MRSATLSDGPLMELNTSLTRMEMSLSLKSTRYYQDQVILWFALNMFYLSCFCVVEGTPYFGGRFRLKLVIGPEYPNTPPKGYFITKIYHPNVASNGDICVNTLKRDWTPDVVLKHVFQIIRCLLIVPFPESSLNDEAGKLFMDSYEEFARRARIMTEVLKKKFFW